MKPNDTWDFCKIMGVGFREISGSLDGTILWAEECWTLVSHCIVESTFAFVWNFPQEKVLKNILDMKMKGSKHKNCVCMRVRSVVGRAGKEVLGSMSLWRGERGTDTYLPQAARDRRPLREGVHWKWRSPAYLTAGSLQASPEVRVSKGLLSAESPLHM